MSEVSDLTEFRLRLAKSRRECEIPNTDPDFVRFLMNELDRLVYENEKMKKELEIE